MADHPSNSNQQVCTTDTCATECGCIGVIDKHHLLLRRLHSLSGIIPVGIFVLMHLFTNFQMWPALFGKATTFQHEVGFIHHLPALDIIEMTLWLSIAFHAALGVVYIYTGQTNTKKYPHTDNRRYAFQRITGFLALIFIFLHIATLRWRWSFFGWFTPFYESGVHGENLAMATTARALQAHWLIVVFYLVGALSVVYHWSNGLWTAAITWGLTITVSAQKRWGYVCTAMGIALTIFTLGAVAGALAYDVSPKEKELIQQRIENSSHDHSRLRVESDQFAFAKTANVLTD